MTVPSRELVAPQYLPEGRPLSISVTAAGQQLDVALREDDYADLGLAIDETVRSHLQNISQLGLKELWLGGRPSAHTRWQHSLGALAAGMTWLKVLEEDGRVHPDVLESTGFTWRQVKALICTALVLHDVGHLPFSHLIEEVLDNINWLPDNGLSGSPSGLEPSVLVPTLYEPRFECTWNALVSEFPGVDSAVLHSLVEQLILGRFPIPWMQVIVNSSIDADKLDYIRFDSEFLRSTAFPISARIQSRSPAQWLTEFLQTQYVNGSGLVCLEGRSAIAASDLWRERVFLYDRFYLAPELRVPERIAFEIISAYVIRTTMSVPFHRSIWPDENFTFADLMEAPTDKPKNAVYLKFASVTHVMGLHLPKIDTTGLEWDTLSAMMAQLQTLHGVSMDGPYLDFLQAGFDILTELRAPAGKGNALGHIVERSLVREPLIIPREKFKTAREALRPLQHAYCRQALIDIVKLPRALSSPFRWSDPRGAPRVAMDYSILVPSGPIATWTARSRAATPLTDESVASIDRAQARVCVIAPNGWPSSSAAFIWDRVRSTLLDAGVEIL